MKAYVYGEPRQLPADFADYFDRAHTAIVSIDMHQGHLSDDPQCPCPAPRARDAVAPIDAFHDAARKLGVPIIHVRAKLRKGGVDDVKGLRASWRRVFPLYVGDIPGADQHAIEGSRWTEFVTRVEPDDLIVETKKRLSAFHPTDLDFLLRNMGVRSIVLNGGFTDCCVLEHQLRWLQPRLQRRRRPRSLPRHQCRHGGCRTEDHFAASRRRRRFQRPPRRMVGELPRQAQGGELIATD